MRILIDLNRCQNYGQCIAAAPRVFALIGPESIEYDHAPGPEDHAAVRRAALACPMSAIRIGAAIGIDAAGSDDVVRP